MEPTSETSIQKVRKSLTVDRFVAFSAGLLAAAVVHHRIMTNGRTLALCKDAANALINDETNFVRFQFKNGHVFHVHYEH